MQWKLLAPMSAALLLVLSGCGGGGGGGGSSTPSKTAVRFSIAWAARTKSISGPAASVSAILTVTPSGSSTPVIQYTVNRSADLAAHTDSYVTPQQVAPGNYTFTLSFRGATDGGGSEVAVAGSNVNLGSNGNLPNVTTQSKITSLEVLGAPTVDLGAKISLIANAKDASNELVAVTPGTFTWTAQNGTGSISLTDGVVTGNTLGAASVHISSDGLQSPAFPITVTAPGASVSFKVDLGNENYTQDGDGAWTRVGDPTNGSLKLRVTDAKGRYGFLTKRNGVVNIVQGTLAESNAWDLTEEKAAPTPSVKMAGAAVGLAADETARVFVGNSQLDVNANGDYQTTLVPTGKVDVIGLVTSTNFVARRWFIKRNVNVGADFFMDLDFSAANTVGVDLFPAAGIHYSYAVKQIVTTPNGTALTGACTITNTLFPAAFPAAQRVAGDLYHLQGMTFNLVDFAGNFTAPRTMNPILMQPLLGVGISSLPGRVRFRWTTHPTAQFMTMYSPGVGKIILTPGWLPTSEASEYITPSVVNIAAAPAGSAAISAVETTLPSADVIKALGQYKIGVLPTDIEFYSRSGS